MSPNQSLNTNQVGYAQKNLRKNSMIVTPQFLGIANSEGKVDLQSITCRDEDTDVVFIKQLDSVGAVVHEYLWTIYGGENFDETYWLDGTSMEKAEGVEFSPGEGLWVQGESTDNTFTTSGQVGTKDVVVQLRRNATLTGNPSPVEIDLQDILCRDEDTDVVFIKQLDSVGAVVHEYIWTIYGGENFDEKYWLDGTTMEKAIDVKFAPGEGLWVQADSTENLITFPAAEL